MKDAAKREARLRLFEKYEALVNPPPVSTEQAAALGVSAPGSNDAVDQELLAAIVGDAAEYLVTEDDRIHRRARRMGVGDRALFVADAMAMLTALHVNLPQPPPALQRVKTHELNLADPIFDGLREDYDGFDDWFRKAARNQRDALLVVRLRIDLAEGFAATLDFGDDVFGGGFPDERFGVGVPVLGPGGDRGGEVAHAGEDAAA